MTAGAQSASDPVLMTINGKPVTKAEFEYSYYKNSSVEGAVEQKSVREYVPMFINYKLKVAAAEAAGLDTLSSFKQEFRTYRDMQLTPYMVDQAYIDSIAHGVYDRTLKQLGGKDLIRPAHILIAVAQKATDVQKQAAKAKADSIYQALQGGADFAQMAKQFSADTGSKEQGGQLPLLGPGATVKEFEEAAYALKTGETSQPVLSPFGYHIIRMTERKPLDPYDSVKVQIMAMLKQNNIEEASAEHRIKQIVDASNGRLTREAVLDSVLAAHIDHEPSLRYLVQEYHDGLLLYEISKREVWDAAATDTLGLTAWYKQHKKDYAWTEPHFKGYVYHLKNVKQEKDVKKFLKKHADGEWRKLLKETFNQDSVSVSISGPYLCKAGDNRYIDAYGFKKGNETKPMNGFVKTGVYGKKQKQPQSFLDVKAQVTNDYQAEKEKLWVETLRRQFTFTVDEQVLSTIKEMPAAKQ